MSTKDILLIIFFPVLVVVGGWIGFKILYNQGVFDKAVDTSSSVEIMGAGSEDVAPESSTSAVKGASSTTEVYDVASLVSEINSRFEKTDKNCFGLEVLSYSDYLARLEKVKAFITEDQYKTLVNKINSAKSYCETISKDNSGDLSIPSVNSAVQDKSEFVNINEIMD